MTTVVTKEVGGTAKPVGALYIEPDRQVVDAGSGTELASTGLDPAVTADLLSACLAHERCGVHLYRSVAERTRMPELRERYVDFGEETAHHVELLEDLIASSGGDPNYVSPSARASEKAGAGLVETTWVLAGSLDVSTAELAMLEAVMLAEAKDLANWQLLAMLGAQMAEGTVREQALAVSSEVLEQELEHHGWASHARMKLLFGLATGGLEPPDNGLAAETQGGVGADGEGMTKSELYAAAQDLEVEGRSQMSKDELAAAVAEAEGGA